ncbi:tetratricopeptide repeat protein [Thaumasiovibrio subtropicus]|uniref:tetratricopeptide repeat protein n=1 Tax=Thaumasiovibrio subtropicus TaxID=1891207 RepID=UPI00131CCAE9|nr:tetratricopeptide repeat protein [Thaumasiovibrio subtropicus]
MNRFLSGMIYVVMVLLSNATLASNTTSPTSHLVDTLALVKLEANEGDRQMQLFLGQAYLYGESGIEKDPLRAFHWLKMAAENDVSVQLILGKLFHRGEGLPKDLDAAFYWYKKAATSGDMAAMEAVATFYATGIVRSDSRCENAIDWFQAAAGQGSLDSRRNLVWLYATCPDESQRDGDRALKIAKQLMARLPEVEATDFDNLAAAYAACGEFDKAIYTQQKALNSLAEEENDPSRLVSFQQRLERYKQHQMWIDE